MPAFDTSELRVLATDLGRVPGAKTLAVRDTIVKGATKIKDAMREDMEASKHFRGAARAITFDINTSRDGIVAEIGPKVGDGESGGHAGIAYGTGAFAGGSRGGDSVQDPVKRLDQEAPIVSRELAKILGDVL